jgi:dTDP-4-amino-4,6-dideoxygalactose transaminase
MIPFLSLKAQTTALRADILTALGAVIDAQEFVNGSAGAAFANALSAYLGCREVVVVNSGTSALHGALICAGVGAGDEVITVPHTWISTSWAISYTGARPVFVDVDRGTCGIDPARIEAAITPRTRAILLVHLYGHPVDLDPVMEIARRRDLAVVEDCAQSLGARYRGRHTGTFGLVNATSFYPGKNLGGFGEGGAVLTDEPAIANRLRALRDHAQSERHHHTELGFNWRMDSFQGAVLTAKLPRLDEWNARRRQIAARYLDGMAGTPGLGLPTPQVWAEPNWHIFSVFHRRRQAFRTRLEQLGVQTSVHYPRPIHLQPAYAWLGYHTGDFPVSEDLAATQVSLPMFPEMSDQQVNTVIDAVRAAAIEVEHQGE